MKALIAFRSSAYPNWKAGDDPSQLTFLGTNGDRYTNRSIASLKQNELFHHDPSETKQTLDQYIETMKAKELNDRGFDKTYRANLIQRLETAFLITFDLVYHSA